MMSLPSLQEFIRESAPQLRLHIGMFEVTDLLLNTAGAVLGAALSLGLRRLVIGKNDLYAGL